MWRRRTRPVPGGTRAFVYALVLHVTVLLLLGVSLRFSARTPEPPRVVQATVVEEAPKRAEPPDTARLEEQRRRESAEAERARQAELKRQEDERKQKAEEARRQKEAERKRKAEATERKKAAALEKKRAEERHRKEAESALQEQVAAEEKRRSDAERLRKEQSEIDKYHRLIKQQVSRSWNIPATSRKGLKCTLRVRVVPGGEVLAVDVIVSSGDSTFDRSAVNAIHKASPLQVPADTDLFNRVFREFNFYFDPEKK